VANSTGNMRDDEWALVILRITAGRCIPVLGPGASKSLFFCLSPSLAAGMASHRCSKLCCQDGPAPLRQAGNPPGLPAPTSVRSSPRPQQGRVRWG
jgi:hypothetical protein